MYLSYNLYTFSNVEFDVFFMLSPFLSVFLITNKKKLSTMSFWLEKLILEENWLSRDLGIRHFNMRYIATMLGKSMAKWKK